jgi:hypothetical protein
MGAAADCHDGNSIEADECATLRVWQWAYCQCQLWWCQKYLDKFTNAGIAGCPVRVAESRFTQQLQVLSCRPPACNSACCCAGPIVPVGPGCDWHQIT